MLNVLMILAYYAANSVFGIDLNSILGLYFPKSEQFKPVQFVTHMFMHGGIMHIFFNMYALFIFGPILENVWGPKRFFIFYMVCGLGAAFTYETVIFFQYNHLIQSLAPENIQLVLNEGTTYFHQGKVFTDPDMQSLQILPVQYLVFCLHSEFCSLILNYSCFSRRCLSKPNTWFWDTVPLN
jgi:hypothetical protein